MLSVFVLKLSAQVTKGAMPQFYVLFYANYTILTTQRGGMVPSPPKYAPVHRRAALACNRSQLCIVCDKSPNVCEVLYLQSQ